MSARIASRGSEASQVPSVENDDLHPLAELALAVPGMRCGGCVATVERTLTQTPGVVFARANLTAKRVTVRWREDILDRQAVLDRLERAGFPGHAFRDAAPVDRQYERSLLLCLGVAGFAATNIMMLSIAVWWGEASDMDVATQTLFHWISALIALPVVAFAGRPFYRSALAALRTGRLNMDVPISLAILLATAMSLFQTIRSSSQVYFDGATALLFFLLVGRYLDTIVRRGAQEAAANLLALQSDRATLVNADGVRCDVAIEDLRPGDIVAVAAGERIPVDGIVRRGASDLDASLITGESQPVSAFAGAMVHAGVMNLTGAIDVETTATGDGTLLAGIARLMESAQQGRARYVRLADRVSRYYAPVVHVLGAATFAGTMLVGHGWAEALTRAIAVLIVTCPCALALAVPAAQVAAAGRLFREGVLLKSADALERFAEIDTVVMDKTGTLTLGQPRLVNADAILPDVLRRAASLAATSRHPLSRALLHTATANGPVAAAQDTREVPGCGVVCTSSRGETRLGSAAFAGAQAGPTPFMQLWFAAPGETPVRFLFEDELRPDAREAIVQLRRSGHPVVLLSGDRPEAVAAAAQAAGIGGYEGGLSPAGKIARLDALRTRPGRGQGKPLMVGDGLNDAPALTAAYASISPSSAADIAQVAADAVFQGKTLASVATTLRVARRTRAVVIQNFVLAFGYNILFVPLAMAGIVTPLIAAIAMSSSSISVTLNALRLRRA